MKKWLDKYKEGGSVESTMDGLTDKGFNYNGAWGGQFQMGGVLPGAVGFTYARTQGAAPSNGPYAKKTKASAQNGMEMKYYQEGLDFSPKTISQDGTKIPLLPIDRKAVSENTRVVVPQRDMRTADEVKAAAERARFFEALANQPVIKSSNTPIDIEERNRRNKTYAQQYGRAYDEASGTVGPAFSPNAERTMNRAAENIVLPALDIEMGMGAAKLVGAGAKAAGKYLRGYKEIKVPKPNFKSEINWAKWNKEIPENKALMQEYNAIEQQTKANGTWMKNPDGSTFQGTPEQFVQQNSENFKKAFPNVLRDEVGNIQKTYHGSQDKFSSFDPNIMRVGRTRGQGIYTSPIKERAATYANKGEKQLYEFYQNANKKQTLIEDFNALSQRRFDDFLKKNPKSSKDFDKKFKAFMEQEDLIYNKEVTDDMFNLQKGYDFYKASPDEYVVPFTNYPKSAIGNNGMFNMTNPNIYKSLAPIGLGLGAVSQIEKKQDGGYIPVDSEGYWNPDNWGNPVIIPSTDITMEGVYEPLIGISDTGDVQYMEPGEDYEFDGEYVTEYPVAQAGKNIPTTADSLRVYNAALATMNYYKNDRRHRAPSIDEYTGPITRADVDQVGIENLNMYRKMFKDISDPTFSERLYKVLYGNDYGISKNELLRRIALAIKEAKSAPSGISYYKDAFPSKIDINAPSAVVDARIQPQGFIFFSSSVPRDTNNLPTGPEPAGTVTGVYYYDPLAVKPYHMRTPEEKEKWEKKYGKPKPNPKPNPKLKPIPTPVVQKKEQSKSLVPVPPAEPKYKMRGDSPIYGPSGSLIGMIDRKTKEFYPDYLNEAARAKVNKTDTDILSDSSALSDYFKSMGQNDVRIVPKKKSGGNINQLDEYPIEKLDNLLNFTNYNKSTKGGWLDKYQ